MENKKAVFFVAEDFGFVSHRIPMAEAVSSCGFDVVVVAHENQSGNSVEIIKNLGFRFIPISIKRGSVNIFNELITIKEFYFILRKEQPDLLFNVALKPIIYGSLCASLYKSPRIINLISGTGSFFIKSANFKIKFISCIIKGLLKIVLGFKNQFLIVQNSDDLSKFKPYMKKGHIKKIRGSGIDIKVFKPLPEPPNKTFTATFVGRMIRDKGVFEFIEAAKILKTKNKNIKMLLVGSPDPENPSSISKEILQNLVEQNTIDWIPHTNDIVSIWKRSNLAVLPSYSEGSPKSLIEAAACQRAIVTTNVNGCRELVKHGATGILVPPKNPEVLAKEISKLAADPNLRGRLAENACKYVRKNYASSVIQRQIVDLIKDLPENSLK